MVINQGAINQKKGDRQLLRRCKKHLPLYLFLLLPIAQVIIFHYLKSKEDEQGLIAYGLYDWAGPFKDEIPGNETFAEGAPTPLRFTDSALYIEFMQRTIFAAQHVGDTVTEAAIRQDLKRVTAAFKREYLLPDGRCSVNEQTAVAMMIGLGLYDNYDAIREQLRECVEACDFHMHTGMLGVRFLYDALNTCRLPEYAYRIIAAKGFPSYTQWLEQGATTLWETFYEGTSKNHHMYSCFMQFLMNTLVGINPAESHPGMRHIELKPAFVSGLDWCRGLRHMPCGDLMVEWHRVDGSVKMKVEVPEGITVRYEDQIMTAGTYEFQMVEL